MSNITEDKESIYDNNNHCISGYMRVNKGGSESYYIANIDLKDGYFCYIYYSKLASGMDIYLMVVDDKGVTHVNKWNDSVRNNSINCDYFYHRAKEGWNDEYDFEYMDVDSFNLISMPLNTVIMSNIPIFDFNNQEAIERYIQYGDLSGADNGNDILYGKTYLDVYIDGDTRPNITVGLTTEKNSDSADLDLTGSIFIGAYFDNESKSVSNYNIEFNKTMSFTFDSIISSANMDWFQNILYNVNKLFDNCGVTIDGHSSNGGYAQASVSYKGNGTKRSENGVYIRFHYNGESAEDDGYTDPSTNSDSDEGQTTIDTVGLLTTTYILTQERLKNIANKLWDSSFIDNIKLVNNNPIENVCSVKMLPVKVSGEEKAVYIGNVDFGINGEKISSNYSPWYSEKKTINLKSDLPLWANYAPFTKMSIYLPYIGYKELDVNRFMGGTIQVKYIVDVLTGMCKAVILNKLGKVISFDGNCGVDIPLTASNKAQHDFAYLQSVIGGVASVASKDVIGATINVQNAISNPFSSQTHGCNTPTCSSNEGNVIALYIDYPHIQYPSTFAKENGLPCNLSLVLKNCKGYTKVASDNIDLSGIPCLDEEKERLRNILTSGFIANW